MSKMSRRAPAPPSAASRLLFSSRAPAPSPADQLRQAVDLLRQGQSSRAEALLRPLLEHPDAGFDALHLTGLIHMQRAEPAEALRRFEQAAQLREAPAPLLNNMGIALRELGRASDALAHYELALARQPAYVEALINRGNVQRELNERDGALASYDAALALQRDHPQALTNRALVLRDLGRLEDALASSQHALAVRPGHAEAELAAALILLDIKQPEQALAACERALAVKAYAPEVLNAKGNALEELQRAADALACYELALRHAPGHADALANRASALETLHRHDDALQAYQLALAASPERAGLHANAAQLLARLGRHPEAIDRYRAALRLDAQQEYAAGGLLHSQLHLCDWDEHGAQLSAIEAGVAAGQRVVQPFHFIAMSQRPELHRRCAESFVQHHHPPRPPLQVPRAAAPADGRLRLAYVSADLHDHATAHLMAEVFEAHDRTRFETWAISLGPETGDPMQTRLEGAFDHIVKARTLSDRAVAERMSRAGIDIAIDLKGHTRDSRPDIFAWLPAPLQVNFLGYPGTLAAPYITHLLADATLIPTPDERHYTEQVLRLPGSYQPNGAPFDAGALPSRAAAGLPAHGPVFACFNSAWKIAPPMFASWMRILSAVPDSVLWLLQDHPQAADNLRRAAQAAGVAPQRLVFAPRCPRPEHLARQALADLFLDTLPCGAHTTASDALGQGLPVLTCLGGSFAGRVGASLLRALELPELVTADLPAYEAQAIALASNPSRLRALRDRLDVQRRVSGLFDAERFCRTLEQALTQALSQIRAANPPPNP